MNFCYIPDKDVINIPILIRVEKPPIVIHPSDLIVFCPNAVFHGIKLVGILRDLLSDGGTHNLIILRIYHAPEGISRQFLKFIFRITSEDMKCHPVYIKDPFPFIRPIYEKSTRHILAELFYRTDK